MKEKFEPYCGLACRRDLEDPNFIKLIDNLKAKKSNQFDNSGWDSHWARRWEFPIVYNSIIEAGASNNIDKIMESGSGVTQVPFWLSLTGREVTCVDLDESLSHRWESYKIKAPDLNVNFVEGDMLKLPFEDDTFDLSYSISAIEHTGNAPRSIDEMIRVTKKGGFIIFTMDIDIQDTDSVSKEQFQAVQEILFAKCENFYAYRFFRPSEVLTFNNRVVKPQSQFLIGFKMLLDRIGLYKLKDQTIYFYSGIKK